MSNMLTLKTFSEKVAFGIGIYPKLTLRYLIPFFSVAYLIRYYIVCNIMDVPVLDFSAIKDRVLAAMVGALTPFGILLALRIYPSLYYDAWRLTSFVLARVSFIRYFLLRFYFLPVFIYSFILDMGRIKNERIYLNLFCSYWFPALVEESVKLVATIAVRQYLDNIRNGKPCTKKQIKDIAYSSAFGFSFLEDLVYWKRAYDQLRPMNRDPLVAFQASSALFVLRFCNFLFVLPVHELCTTISSLHLTEKALTLSQPVKTIDVAQDQEFVDAMTTTLQSSVKPPGWPKFVNIFMNDILLNPWLYVAALIHAHFNIIVTPVD